ncbi:hypothetical protein GOODEAATRI_025772, partial [Goodea atripinnis]
AVEVEVIYARVGDNVELKLQQLPQSFYVRWFLDKENGHELASINHVGGSSTDSGHHLNLSCSTGGPLDTNVKVKWFPPKTSSLANTELTSRHLIIQKVSTEDSGRWRCELGLEPGLGQNRLTLTSAVITLKIGEHRKREESRKYDMVMNLWPQSFKTETWFYPSRSL